MSRRIITNSLKQPITHFKRKLREFEFKVVPPPEVPAHIIKPQYAIDTKHPIYASYDGHPQVLNEI